MRNIEYRIRRILAETTGFDHHQRLAWLIASDSILTIEMELDELDSIEILMTIEDEFDVSVDDEEAASFVTIEDISNWLESKGVENFDMEAYPPKEGVVYLPVESSPAPDSAVPNRYVVVFANALTVSGLDANVYEDDTEARTFAHRLKERSVYAEVYKLVKI